MVECPKCRAQLPDWTQTCQFCGQDVRSVARPPSNAKPKAMYEPPAWVNFAYYAIAVYWIVSGLFRILSGLGVFDREAASPLLIIVGAIGIVFGVGLIARVEIVRGIVNFVCGLNIIFGLFSLGGIILGSVFAGPIAILWVIYQLIDIAQSAFLIFLIAETERNMPNV